MRLIRLILKKEFRCFLDLGILKEENQDLKDLIGFMPRGPRMRLIVFGIGEKFVLFILLILINYPPVNF